MRSIICTYTPEVYILAGGLFFTIISSIITHVCSNKKFRKEIRISTLASYIRRYHEILINMPEGINDEHFAFKELPLDVQHKTMRYIRVYIDLCSEQYDLKEEKIISARTWENWQTGIVPILRIKTFSSAWLQIKKDTYYSEKFIKWVDKMIENIDRSSNPEKKIKKKFINIIRSKMFQKEKKGLLFILIFLFTWLSFQNVILELFDKHLLQFFNIESSWLSQALFIVIIVSLLIYFIYKAIKNRYVVKYWHILSMIIFPATAIYTGTSSNRYNLKPEIWSHFSITGIDLSYINIFLLSIILYALILLCIRLFSKKKTTITNNKFVYYSDQPKTSITNDELHMETHVDTVIQILLSVLDKSETIKVGLIAMWGEGKSTFMNFIRERLQTDDLKKQFIIINFNPRLSESISHIQKDFFNTFNTELRIYSSKFSLLIKVYMNAIGILDGGLFSLFKEQEDKCISKQNINDALNLINKKILIIIDDFDRLLKDEIVEILKLIDGNASFEHTIFITAYDKKQVGITLSELGEDFIDKYFTWEYHIPKRPRNLFMAYLCDELSKLLAPNKIELFQEIRETEIGEYQKQQFSSYRGICEELVSNDSWTDFQYHFNRELLTHRDINRFLNFIQTYIPYMVKEMLSPHDMLLLCLIRFKYPAEYEKMHSKFSKKYGKIFVENFIPLDDPKDIEEEYKEFEKSAPIVRTLFPNANSNTFLSFDSKEDKRRNTINDSNSFEIYFYLDIKSKGTIEENQLIEIFDRDISSITRTLNRWKNEGIISRFVEYLPRREQSLENLNDFIRYIDIVFILYSIHSSNDVQLQIAELLLSETSEKITNAITELNQEAYKSQVKKKLSDGGCRDLIKEYIISLINEPTNRSKFIFSLSEFQEIALDNLRKYVKSSDIDTGSTGVIPIFYDCIEDIDQKTREISLSREACNMVKDVIIKNPKGYCKDFVRLAGFTSSPDFNRVACEPFWVQIFGETKDKAIKAFSSFITSLDKEIEKKELITNFWKLYEKNDYKPIQFENQGNVQQKIEENLEAEIKLLDALQDVEKDINLLAEENNDSNILLEKLDSIRDKLMAIDISLKFRGELFAKLEKMRSENML